MGISQHPRQALRRGEHQSWWLCGLCQLQQGRAAHTRTFLAILLWQIVCWARDSDSGLFPQGLQETTWSRSCLSQLLCCSLEVVGSSCSQGCLLPGLGSAEGCLRLALNPWCSFCCVQGRGRRPSLVKMFQRRAESLFSHCLPGHFAPVFGTGS